MNIDDNLFDNEIKRKLKEENNEIPDYVNKIFDNIEAQGIKEKTKRSKKIARVCAAAMVAITLFGVSMPAYASKIPIVGNFFALFDDDRYKNHDKYSSDLNITKESNGIKVTIDKVVYDGISLDILYTIESENPIQGKTYFLDKSIEINGKETTFSSGENGEFSNENRIYKGMMTWDVAYKSQIPKEVQEETLLGGYVEIPDEFILNINISKIGDREEKEVVKGKWNFEIPVSNEQLKESSKEYIQNTKLNIDGKEISIDKVIVSPINTTIMGTHEVSSGLQLGFIAFDDKGRKLNMKCGNLYGDTTEVDKYEAYINYNFVEPYNDSESITFVPYTGLGYSTEDDKVIEKLSNNEEINSNEIKDIKVYDKEKFTVKIK